MTGRWGMLVGTAAAGALIALSLSPALATSSQGSAKKHVAHALAASLEATIDTFTPSAADPRLAASLSSTTGDEFRFTPSTTPGSHRAVTIAVRARATTRAEAQRTVAITSAATPTPTSVQPSAYNLGVAVGWQRFALSGEVAHIDTGALPGGREAADVAISYGGAKWSTKFQLNADRANPSDESRLIGSDKSVSVDLGTSYALTRSLAVTGGVRYRIDRDQSMPSLVDDRRDSQAIYVGTAFRF